MDKVHALILIAYVSGCAATAVAPWITIRRALFGLFFATSFIVSMLFA